MSKKVSVTTSKSGLNPNTPTYNPTTIRWQSTYMPVSQLALSATGAPPGLWTPIGAPITAGYGYGYPFNPRFAPPPAVPPHSNYCCYNQRHQCGPAFDHNCNGGWPTSGSNCWSNSHSTDCHNNSNSSPNGVAITEVKDDSKEESDDDSDTDTKDKKNIKTLQLMNEELAADLEETKQKLREREETILKLREQLSTECLEYYRKNLKKYGDYIREEVTRFYQNEEMAQKLKPIVEQISNASHHIKEEKERTKQSNLTARHELNNDRNPDLSANFSPHSLPDFPDMLTFYKSILDEIPLIFLNDLSQLKRLTNNFIQTTSKNKLSNNGLPITSPFGDELSSSLKQLSSTTNTLFSAPKISDLPKPDFNTLPLKPVAGEASESPALEFNFPRNLSPISLPDSITYEPISSTPLLDIIPSNKTKDKSLSPIGKPVQPVIDLKAICAEKVKNSQQNSTLSVIGEIFRTKTSESKLETDPIRAPMNPIPRFSKPKLTTIDTNPAPVEPTPVSIPTPAIEIPKPVINQARSRLLIKLKEKYPLMSDQHLIDSMAQTKAVLIASGNPQGFTGMKIADIVTKISDYIDHKVLSNNFSKPRLTEMKSNSTQNNIETVTGKLNKTSAASKKAWNTIDHKGGKFDDSICSICFESISMATRYETECQHFFHHSCINNWIRTDGSCPICRRLVLPPGEFPEL